MSPRPLARWSAALALALLGCQRHSSALEHPDDPATRASSPAAPDADEPSPQTEPSHPLELVPARARMMLMARSPLRLAEAWERDRLAGAHPLQYEKLVGDMKRELGYDLLDPADLARTGIDPSAPIGFAMLSIRDEAFVTFGGLTDPRPLVEALERGSGKALSRQSVGTAELYAIDSELTLVVRGRFFAFVLVDRGHPESPDYAREVARIDPARSLAHAPVLERAFAGLPAEADLQGMLDPAGLMHDGLERDRQSEQEILAQANQRLAEARQRGATVEELDSLQQQLEGEERFVARRRRERQVTELLLSRTVGSIEGIGMAVDASDRGLLGRIHMGLSADSSFRELLVESDLPPTALTTLSDDPLLVLSGRVDLNVAIGLVSQVALAAGDSYAELNDEIREKLRVDFDRELRPLLDGSATFATTVREPRPGRAAKEPLQERFGGVLSLGVVDEAKARELLERATAQWKTMGARIQPAPEVGGHRVELPDDDGPSELWVSVAAGQLVATTDLAALRRLRDGGVGPGGAHWSDPEAWTRLTTGPAAARLAMHHRMPMFMLFAFIEAFDSFDFPREVDFELEAEFPGEDLRSIPRGKQVKRLEKQRAKAQAEMRTHKDERRQQKMLAMWQHAGGLGLTAATVHVLDSGLMYEGGHYVSGGVGAYAETLMGFDELDDASNPSDQRIEELRARVEELDGQILEARRREVQRALEKR